MKDGQPRDTVSEQGRPNVDIAVLEKPCCDLGVSDVPTKTLQPDIEFFDNEYDVVEKLRELFPHATQEELLRFCRARGGVLEAASDMYKAYLEWRQGQGSPANLLKAYQAIDSKYARHTGFAKDGSPLILCQGARYDPEVGAETTALALAHFTDSIFTATDTRKTTLLIDVRPHEGWPNVPAAQMMPLFRLAASIFSDNYPERSARVIIFPMPALVRGFWALVSRLFDSRTRNKFVILGGSAEKGSPCPEELGDYVALDQLPVDARHMFAELRSNSRMSEEAE